MTKCPWNTNAKGIESRFPSETSTSTACTGRHRAGTDGLRRPRDVPGLQRGRDEGRGKAEAGAGQRARKSPASAAEVGHRQATGVALRRSTRIDESLKVGFWPDGKAWAEAPAGERPRTFSSRARTKADATKSPNIAEFCKRWATKWDAQNPQ